jgi:aspartyl protease family protein
MKLLNILFLFFLFAGCDHPETRDFERNQRTSSKPKDLEVDVINTEDTQEYIDSSISKEEIAPLDLISEERNILKMERENGVKYVWIEINGIRLRFIFDTGASNICISPAEASVLYRQGTLRKEDILDTQYFQDATGRISEGTKINLRTVKIGSKNLENIEATVIDNSSAPLLLGQSVLENFGKIEIDNENGEIIFK